MRVGGRERSAYRQEPDAAGDLSPPILWRPWMTRLATVLGVLASPALTVGIWAWSFSQIDGTHRLSGWWFLAMVLSGAQTVIGCAGMGVGGMSDKLTPAGALRFSWAWLYYPCLWAYRAARWVAYGSGS